MMRRVRCSHLGDEDSIVFGIVGIDSFPIETSIDTNAEWFARVPCQYHFLQAKCQWNRSSEPDGVRSVPTFKPDGCGS